MPVIFNPATGFAVGDPDRHPLDSRHLPSAAEVSRAASSLILSAAGWRKVFASPLPRDPRAPWAKPAEASAAAAGGAAGIETADEDSLSARVSQADLVLAASMARVYALALLERIGGGAGNAAGFGSGAGTGNAAGAGAGAGGEAGPRGGAKTALEATRPAVLLGMDSRRTGPALADAIARVLVAMGLEVRHLFIVAAPEIMAYAAWTSALPQDHPERAEGFVYVSASHNPPGHNGLKFGIRSGGVLSGAEAVPLITAFRAATASEDLPRSMLDLMAKADRAALAKAYGATMQWKRRALSAYTLLSHRVVTGREDLAGQGALLDEMADACAADPVGVVAEMNGSARALAPDRDWLEGLGVRTRFLNDRPGDFVHRIVPEGHSLDLCRTELEKAHAVDPSFVLGYSPDCDGDRGNLVWIDRHTGVGRILEAQEVFALCCVAELAGLVREGTLAPPGRAAAGAGRGAERGARVAVVVNDGTSMRIERIASRFGAEVFRAETGEANVVGLADRLRAEGVIVRILGEGSNGGNITHPSMVRDPLATVAAMLKLLRLRDGARGGGLFRIWLEASGTGAPPADFDLGDVIGSLPKFSTTSVFEPRAMLRVSTRDAGVLKSRYERIFLREWPARAAELEHRFRITGWKAVASVGTGEFDAGTDFAASGNGGLRIVLTDRGGLGRAFLWMRGSGTEPVFRVMADVEDGSLEDEEFLLGWHTSMVREADMAGGDLQPGPIGGIPASGVQVATAS